MKFILIFLLTPFLAHADEVKTQEEIIAEAWVAIHASAPKQLSEEERLEARKIYRARHHAAEDKHVNMLKNGTFPLPLHIKKNPTNYVVQNLNGAIEEVSYTPIAALMEQTECKPNERVTAYLCFIQYTKADGSKFEGSAVSCEAKSSIEEVPLLESAYGYMLDTLSIAKHYWSKWLGFV